MHIQYQSFITELQNTIQSSVVFITVVHYSEIAVKQMQPHHGLRTKKENGKKKRHNQAKKRERERKLQVTVRESRKRIFHECGTCCRGCTHYTQKEKAVPRTVRWRMEKGSVCEVCEHVWGGENEKRVWAQEQERINGAHGISKKKCIRIRKARRALTNRVRWRRKGGRMYVVLREGAQARRCYTSLRRYIVYVCRYIAKYIDGKTKVL